MGRVLIYKLTSDEGGAPCVTDELLTLAICKPGYRLSAVPGDWLFGFLGKSVDPLQPLVYIAEITDKLPVGLYYTTPRYHNRLDCIYEIVGGTFRERADSQFHNTEEDRRKDLGVSLEQMVLLSRNFRYFGDQSITLLKERYPRLVDFVDAMTQTHYPKNAHPSELLEECQNLIGTVWLNHECMKIGKPLHPIGSGCRDGSMLCDIDPDAMPSLGHNQRSV